jgi:D-alanine--poly(phosphoribitol) ligase subunit 2
MSTADEILRVLAAVTETEEVKHNLDLRVYDLQILDSLKTVELMVAFSEQLGVEISPAEFEREQWATPRQIIAYVESKMAEKAGACP